MMDMDGGRDGVAPVMEGGLKYGDWDSASKKDEERHIRALGGDGGV